MLTHKKGISSLFSFCFLSPEEKEISHHTFLFVSCFERLFSGFLELEMHRHIISWDLSKLFIFVVIENFWCKINKHFSCCHRAPKRNKLLQKKKKKCENLFVDFCSLNFVSLLKFSDTWDGQLKRGSPLQKKKLCMSINHLSLMTFQKLLIN